MKYLKLFEQVNLYSKIDVLEFNNKVFGKDSEDLDDGDATDYILDNWVSFNKKEFNIISDLCNIYNESKIYTKGNQFLKMKVTGNDVTSSLSPLEKLFEVIRVSNYFDDRVIYKLKDEWYYIGDISDRIDWFKCDQLEGLISCLKNEIFK